MSSAGHNGADDLHSGAGMILGTSPRTTIIGYLGAIATALIPVLQGDRLTPRTIAVAIVIGLLGRFAKDVSDTGPGN